VLQDWDEIGRAYRLLHSVGLPTHQSVEKNWDLAHLHGVIRGMDKNVLVLDMGSGGVDTLQFMSRMGFTSLHGIELSIPYRDRLRQLLTMYRQRTPRVPYRLHRGDLTRTKFSTQTFDVLTCISVIEHGVDFEAFLYEARRLLRRDGLLFVTTDYWEPKIEVSPDHRIFGLPWRIFSRAEMTSFLTMAADYDFVPLDGSAIPSCKDRCVEWDGKEYTFALVVLQSRSGPSAALPSVRGVQPARTP
jgi:SAM-dependent methyltransferase